MVKLQKKYNQILFLHIGDIIRAQWNRIGFNGTGGVNHYSVDIESALMVSGYGARLNGRLYEGIWGWLKRYGSLVNAERLSTLIRDANDEWASRFLGGLLEKIDSLQWRGVIEKCKKSRSTSWKETPLLIHAPAGKWRVRDSVLSKWGILYDRLEPSHKLQDHHLILSKNPLMRYRYAYGAVIRADILYLLSVAHHCPTKREIDFLTSVRLAERLSCHLSTIHRIEKDFEEGGLIEPIGEIKKKRALMTTWIAKDVPFPKVHPDYDLGMIDWIQINRLLTGLFHLILKLEMNPNEIIAKAALQQFQIDYFPVLADHSIPLAPPYGTALGALEKYSVEELAGIIVHALLTFHRIICRLLLVRCKKCENVFDSPIQGEISTMANVILEKNIMECPRCRSEFSTAKSDFFYLDGLGYEKTI